MRAGALDMKPSPDWDFIMTQSNWNLAHARSFDPDMEQRLRDLRDRRGPGHVLSFELHRMPSLWPKRQTAACRRA
eukprot:3866420-Alexandrium_andersonii.AAC.1